MQIKQMQNIFNELMKKIKQTSHIDFRSDVYLENEYGATPAMEYDRACCIVGDTMAILYDFVGEDFCEWAFQLEVDKLKTTTLKI